jgi:hypothetical protein
VFGLSSGGESTTDINRFIDAFQVSFPIIPDASTINTSYRQSGGTSPYPLDYIIDQAGRVAYHGTEYDPETMTAIIDNLLLHPAPVSETPLAPVPLYLDAQPNPFNPRTAIIFEMARPGLVNLDIHDARGRLVRRLASGDFHDAGRRTVFWDGTDDRGRYLPSGIYLAHVTAGGQSATTKLTLVR